MKTNGYEIGPYKSGWRLRIWRDGINPRTKEETITNKDTYYSNLEQTLKAALDNSAKRCTTAAELLRKLTDAHLYLDNLLVSNGLVGNPERMRHRIDAESKRWLEQKFVGVDDKGKDKWVTVYTGEVCSRIYR